MLSGEYSHNIDQKGRIIMPAKLREEIGDVFYITSGLDGCLSVYSVEEFERVARSLASLPTNREGVRLAQRRIVSSAVQCETDKQGRFVIPPKLRERAELERAVTIIGNIGHVEIWDADKWESYTQGEEGLTLEDAIDNLEGFVL